MPETWTYILHGTTPVPEPNAAAWEAWMRASLADGSRVVAQTDIGGRLRVPTVFSEMDQDLDVPDRPDFDRPVVFETAVFENGELTEAYPYDSWQGTEAGHARLVAELNAKA